MAGAEFFTWRENAWPSCEAQPVCTVAKAGTNNGDVCLIRCLTPFVSSLLAASDRQIMVYKDGC